ncbi:MAG: thioredoxin [Candidatus Levybacteria bacterium RIFCSPHIGHO2_01_FULL_37_17]|nr:MAG: thioredoxin [Candidatus Levybacteria bacterium RIFCSPHIGHO2_01_FULL_37_17]OGH36512.1 MAG: thioredoxin [Candidatus Levybacteria bacterium RIFCSPLOWO2_01_FULL_38_23]
MADLTFTDQNFAEEVLQSQTPVVVDFWAAWCVPCRIVSPIVEELAKDYSGKIKVGKMDVDANGITAQNYGIMSIPSVVLFKNGQPVKTMIGAQSKDNYTKEIDAVLAS